MLSRFALPVLLSVGLGMPTTSYAFRATSTTFAEPPSFVVLAQSQARRRGLEAALSHARQDNDRAKVRAILRRLGRKK